ncbi:MAG: L-serine ammonia-lyase, iron-sulfur-dependent, subunit alpha [Acholeplasmataceae bacterium]
MESVKTIFKIGIGPSSSHTMGPAFAAQIVLDRHPDADQFEITLFNSLALTGEGHLTDFAISKILDPDKTSFKRIINNNLHPNHILFKAIVDGERIAKYEFNSVGGGDIEEVGVEVTEPKIVYPHSTFNEIRDYCKANNLTLYQYIIQHEDEELLPYLNEVYEAMIDSIKRGLKTTGVLPGPLGVKRRAPLLAKPRMKKEPNEIKENRLVSAYAFAVNEENAAGGIIVTAPTCGACGVLPAVLYYMDQKYDFITRERVLEGLAVAGLIGLIIRKNATISGAVGGCQAEVGSATAMAAAAHAAMFRLPIDQIENAAEIALEHSLGLTCDPVDGYVQIPCIERNAVGAMRAINACGLAIVLTESSKIKFDTVVKTMYQTGLDMDIKYKETARGGLAYFYRKKED